VKSGARALGIAESHRGNTSTLAGAVVRADRVVEAFEFETCTVGGTDATAAIESLFASLDRADVQYLFVAGIAPAWFNIVDLHSVTDTTGRPVLSVSFEESDGLGDAIREAFDGDAATRRLATYYAQPDRRRLAIDAESVFVRSAGIDSDEATAVVRAFTPDGSRPEPLRIARRAARAGERFRSSLAGGGE
jgi:endonuclease V-like protein UPF0215 family